MPNLVPVASVAVTKAANPFPHLSVATAHESVTPVMACLAHAQPCADALVKQQDRVIVISIVNSCFITSLSNQCYIPLLTKYFAS